MTHEDDLSASEVGLYCGGKTITTVHRWSTDGIKRDGERIKLPRRRIGGQYVFKRIDVDEFLRRLN